MRKGNLLFIKISLQIGVLLTGAFVLTNCGQQVGSGSSTCAANVVGSGMVLAVTRLGTNSNSYKFQLCDNMRNPGAFIVYGANSLSTLQQSSNSQRSPTITDAVATGDTFQVDFLPTDTVFAIYYDPNYFGGQSGMIVTHSLFQQ